MTFTVRSNSFNDGDYLAKTHILSAAFGFGCEGDNQSPHLAWSGAPTGTKSFAVTCFDPDAPTGSGFWHWLVVNIPPSVTELALDAGNPQAPKLPSGTLQTRTDSRAGYGGPCPPPGDHPHRYLFTGSQSASTSCRFAPIPAAVIGFRSISIRWPRPRSWDSTTRIGGSMGGVALTLPPGLVDHRREDFSATMMVGILVLPRGAVGISRHRRPASRRSRVPGPQVDHCIAVVGAAHAAVPTGERAGDVLADMPQAHRRPPPRSRDRRAGRPGQKIDPASGGADR
jgi:Raf kinase inhibitor-like YbhB/YbcL family protein